MRHLDRFAVFCLLLGGCGQQHTATVLPMPDAGADAIVAADAPTWYRDVLPLARAHCQGCHRPDGIGSFSMLTYEDAKPHADAISMNVASRTMPPWMPSQECGDYDGDRRMLDADIAVFTAWANAGALPGDPADAPAGGDPAAPHLQRVDATLIPANTYTPIGDSTNPAARDDYHCLVLDPGLTVDRDVVGYEITPGVTREVHHVLLFSATKAATDAADAATPEPGWTCFGGPGVTATGGLGGWVPGMPPIHYPDTTGVRMKAGEVIVMQVHYNLANGPPVPDRTTVQLQFSDTPVQRVAVQYPVPNANFAIPTGGQPYTSTATYSAFATGKIWGVSPHMHTLGREIRVEVGGKCLIDIPSWDFHWQQSYFFSDGGRPVNQGDPVMLRCTWQNTTDHVVSWGESTSDEMCLAFLYVTQ